VNARIFVGTILLLLALVMVGCSDGEWLYDDASYGEGQQIVHAQEALNREAYRLQASGPVNSELR